MATSASGVSLLAQPLPANGTSLWRGSVGVRARAPAPARFAATARAAPAPAPAPAAITKRRTPRFVSVSVSVRCVGVGGTEALPSSVPRSVPVRVAYELQQAGHRYLDVRTEGEFSAGHPEGAVNIPYMNRTGSGMTKNTHFLEQVSRIFGKDDEIIVGCQSGKRSLMAATELCSAGFTAVTDIAGGFSTWRENELPATIQ
ncbi:thiosulfate sulfurtransferase 16, chloroplastic-like [Miscanthus floridulus]|uniref:thiosulfate sulfurtransferase 16, chloroplastic-like n=1 Tax=Miscanthus floridulus TaxID=154761 RepID=UPI0034578D6B